MKAIQPTKNQNCAIMTRNERLLFIRLANIKKIEGSTICRIGESGGEQAQLYTRNGSFNWQGHSGGQFGGF